MVNEMQMGIFQHGMQMARWTIWLTARKGEGMIRIDLNGINVF